MFLFRNICVLYQVPTLQTGTQGLPVSQESPPRELVEPYLWMDQGQVGSLSMSFRLTHDFLFEYRCCTHMCDS